jgi:hypothetical protein
MILDLGLALPVNVTVNGTAQKDTTGGQTNTGPFPSVVAGIVVLHPSLRVNIFDL